MEPCTHYKKTLLASLMAAALAPHSAWAQLDLAQSPPGTMEPYVAPNVIISVDDSGSMDYCLNKEADVNCDGRKDADNNTSPNPDGSWPVTSRRINVLKYALKQVFNDTTLLPDGKIRLAWQAMWNNGGAPGVGLRQLQGYDRLGREVYSPAGATSVDSATKGVNSMAPLRGSATEANSQRKNFLDFANSLSALGSTPSHRMFSQADAYVRRDLGRNSPWSTNPGGTDAKSTEYLGCRRNYHIVMTDGRWNSAPNGGERDGVASQTLPDGTKYGSAESTSNFTHLYRDSFSDTLADWAFRSWSTNLQPPLYDPNNPAKQVSLTSEYRKAAPTETIGGVALPKYWNPKYDPATWPHMVTFTIGFSQLAYTWKTDYRDSRYNIDRPSSKVPFSYDGGFPDLVAGRKLWPDMSDPILNGWGQWVGGAGEDIRALDLWHAALNGRGGFYAVEQGADLEKAFRQIIRQINTESEPDRGSTATSGSSTLRNDVGMYTASYDPKTAWKGWVTAETIQNSGATVASWVGKSTADLLDDPGYSVANRLILSWNDKTSQGVPFRWASDESNLSTAQKAYLALKSDGSSDTHGQDRLNYIRGDRSLEGRDPAGYNATSPFRERKSRQGDIVNSNVWYVGYPGSNYPDRIYAQFTRAQRARQPMVYVGGNDGMLHGFSTADGQEKLAYIPRGVLPGIGRLADPDYNDKHRYFVDGSPMTGDVDVGNDPLTPDLNPDWRTVLVGTLGAGGKGYFVLDVTNPGSTLANGTASNFSEANASTLVRMDKTLHASEAIPSCNSTDLSLAQKTACQDSEDLGHIFARPVLDEANPMKTSQITRLNNNRWAVVMGNGYNSKNQRPVLLVQYLDGNQELLRIPATEDATGSGNAQNNGLSAPRLVDLNSDGRPDVVYAGDLRGNIWKFMIASEDASQWRVAFGGVPLYTAVGGTSGSPNSRTLRQSIVAAPTVRANDRTKVEGSGTQATAVPVGGMMVAFGTGRNVTRTDPENTDVQSLYAVLDNTRYRTVGTGEHQRLEVHPGETCSSGNAGCIPVPAPATVGRGVDSLARQSVGGTSVAGSGTSANRNFWTVEATVAVDWTTHKGWFMDLPQTSERLLKPMELYGKSNILMVYSQVPAKGSNISLDEESCNTATIDDERQYLTMLNIMDGKRPSVQLMNLNGDTNRDGNPIFDPRDDREVSRMEVGKGSHNLIGGDLPSGGGCLNTLIGAQDRRDDLACMPEKSMRPSWRQLR
ncbi:hypothetical protein GCM10027082_45330 [Comamonas humi]